MKSGEPAARRKQEPTPGVGVAAQSVTEIPRMGFSRGSRAPALLRDCEGDGGPSCWSRVPQRTTTGVLRDSDTAANRGGRCIKRGSRGGDWRRACLC